MTTNLLKQSNQKKTPLVNKLVLIIAIALFVSSLYPIIEFISFCASFQKSIAELDPDNWLTKYYVQSYHDQIRPLMPFILLMIVNVLLVAGIVAFSIIGKKLSKSLKTPLLIASSSFAAAIPIALLVVNYFKLTLFESKLSQVIHIVNCGLSILLLILVIHNQTRQTDE